MENNIPIKFKDTIIGYADSEGKIIEIINKKIWDKLFTNNQNVYISSRGLGEVNNEGTIINDKRISFDIYEK